MTLKTSEAVGEYELLIDTVLKLLRNRKKADVFQGEPLNCTQQAINLAWEDMQDILDEFETEVLSEGMTWRT